MRYQMTVLLPGGRTAMGAQAAGYLEDETYPCDIAERDTSEQENATRLGQSRMFDVTLRHLPDLSRDAKVKLAFGHENLTCNVVAIVQVSRHGQTKLVAAHEPNLIAE